VSGGYPCLIIWQASENRVADLSPLGSVSVGLGPFFRIAPASPLRGPVGVYPVFCGLNGSGGLYRAVTGSQQSGVMRVFMASSTKVFTGTIEKEYSGLSISLYPPR